MSGGLCFLGLPEMNLVRSMRRSSRTLATKGRKPFFAILHATGRLLSVVLTPHIIAESESLPVSFAVPKIYFPLILLAQTDIRENLSRIFWDKGI